MASTEALRAKLKGADSKQSLFYLSCKLEGIRIRIRCEAKTHIPAPIKPAFLNAGI